MGGKRSKMVSNMKNINLATILKHVQACKNKANKVHKDMHHKLR
jgi:hypothetical protein